MFDDDVAVGVKDEESVVFLDLADKGAEQGAADLEADTSGEDGAVVSDVRHTPSVDCSDEGSLRNRARWVSFRGRVPGLLRGYPPG